MSLLVTRGLTKAFGANVAVNHVDFTVRPGEKAAVVGDTVGDPFKDTAGPSLHILVKLLSTITLVMAPLLV